MACKMPGASAADRYAAASEATTETGTGRAVDTQLAKTAQVTVKATIEPPENPGRRRMARIIPEPRGLGKVGPAKVVFLGTPR